MRLDFCVVCGSRDDLQHHHFTPRSHGGSNDDTNMITFCRFHHMTLHALNTPEEHRKLVKSGISRAQAKGVRLGPKPAPITAFSQRMPKLTPVERLLVTLYATEQISPDELASVRWVDLVGDFVKTKYRQIKLSETAKNRTTVAIKHLGLSGDGLMQRISVTPQSPEGRDSGAIRVWLSRQRNVSKAA